MLAFNELRCMYYIACMQFSFYFIVTTRLSAFKAH